MVQIHCLSQLPVTVTKHLRQHSSLSLEHPTSLGVGDLVLGHITTGKWLKLLEGNEIAGVCAGGRSQVNEVCLVRGSGVPGVRMVGGGQVAGVMIRGEYWDPSLFLSSWFLFLRFQEMSSLLCHLFLPRPCIGSKQQSQRTMG